LLINLTFFYCIYDLRKQGLTNCGRVASPFAVRLLSLYPRLASRSCVTGPIHHRLTHVNNISLGQPYKRAYPFPLVLRHPWPFQPSLIPLPTLRHCMYTHTDTRTHRHTHTHTHTFPFACNLDPIPKTVSSTTITTVVP
jgi:hypothetical protein